MESTDTVHPLLAKLNFVSGLSNSAQLNNALSSLMLLSKSSLKRSHFNEHEICHPAKSSRYASFIHSTVIRLREFQKFHFEPFPFPRICSYSLTYRLV